MYFFIFASCEPFTGFISLYCWVWFLYTGACNAPVFCFSMVLSFFPSSVNHAYNLMFLRAALTDFNETWSPHHHSTNSYEPIRFLQTSQNRLINIHRKSLKHISQSALFGFSKNIGHDQIWYENSVVFKAVQWLFMIKERSCKLCYIVDSLVKT